MAKKAAAKKTAETDKVAKLAKPGKYIYFFGDGKADGDRTMKDLLGGKGSGLAEMTNAKLPVPAGFTISTPVCTHLLQGRRQDSGVDRERDDRQPAEAREVGRPQAGRHEKAAARVGAFGCEIFDARHDGHDPESRPQRRDGRIAEAGDGQRPVCGRQLPPLHPDVRQRRAGNCARTCSNTSSMP